MANDNVHHKARIAVIGAGWWACEVYVPALLARDDVELVAVNRRNRDALDKVVAQFGVPKGYTDHAEMLATERPDGVVIASPHTAHFGQARDALEAGCHVLVDKPMTTDGESARKLVALAAERDRRIVVPYGWNFKEFTRRAAALVADGRLGAIRHVVCQMASPTADLFGGEGLIETKDHMFRPEASTWADPRNAGGYGWGQLSHALGLMFEVSGLAPAEVRGVCGRSAAGVDYYDAAVMRFENGATAVLSGAATVPKQCGYQLDIRMFGDEGMLLLDVERERMELRRHDGADEVMDVPAGAGAYQCVEPIARLADFCLGRDVVNEASGSIGQRAVETLDAMYRSFESDAWERV